MNLKMVYRLHRRSGGRCASVVVVSARWVRRRRWRSRRSPTSVGPSTLCQILWPAAGASVCLGVNDDYSRECLACIVDTSL